MSYRRYKFLLGDEERKVNIGEDVMKKYFDINSEKVWHDIHTPNGNQTTYFPKLRPIDPHGGRHKQFRRSTGYASLSNYNFIP